MTTRPRPYTPPVVVELPSNAEVGREENPVRKNILAAMQRILLGHPKIVPTGANTVSHLAREARIGRHHLYQSHPDLRFRFEYLRDRVDQPTEKENELNRRLERTNSEITHLRALQIKSSQNAEDWKALTELLARAVSVLQEELHQEHTKSSRLTRRLHELEKHMGNSSPLILMHRRAPSETELG